VTDDREEARAGEVSGTVMEILPRALYRVGVGQGRDVIAHARTGPGRNFVRLVVGDRVQVEISQRDVGRGRIVGKR